MSKREEPKKEEYPIEYPMEPACVNFADIVAEIEKCDGKKSLNTAYVRIVIFSGCYPESKMFLADLWDLYKEKEFEITKSFS